MPLLQVIRGYRADSVLRSAPGPFVIQPLWTEGGLSYAEQETKNRHALVWVEREIGDLPFRIGKDFSK